MRKRQYLTLAQKLRRLERGSESKVFSWKTEGLQSTERDRFSDEKFSTVEATFNNQNDRVYEKSSADIDNSLKTVFRQQMPSFLMVWVTVFKSWMSPLIFDEQGVKINTDRYINDIFQLLMR